MIKITIDSWLDVLKYVGVAVGTGIAITLVFFYIYLPATTNHGESITVPDLEGIPVDELQDFP